MNPLHNNNPEFQNGVSASVAISKTLFKLAFSGLQSHNHEEMMLFMLSCRNGFVQDPAGPLGHCAAMGGHCQVNLRPLKMVVSKSRAA